MSEWKHKPLIEVVDIDIGGTPSRSDSRFWAGDKEGHLWVSIADMNNTSVICNTAEKITDLGVKHSNVKLVPKGTVIMSFKLTLGKVAYAGADLYTNEAIAAFHIKKKNVDPRWLYYSLPEAINGCVIDTAVKGKTLNKDKLQSLSFPLPDIAEQKAIVTVLDTVDEAIQSTQAMLDKQDKIKQGLLHDLLTRGVDERGHLRPSPETAPDLYQQTEIGLIPKGWNLKPLENVATLQRGFDLPIQDRADGDVPVYGSNGVDGWHNQSPLSGPGVITGRSGSIGFVFYSEGPYWPLNTTLYVKNFNGNSPKFVRLILQSMDLKKYVASTGVPSLNRNFVHPVLVAIAEKKEQERIIQRIESIDEVHFSAITDLEKLKNLKSGLMQDLLTGRKRVTPSLMRDVEKLAEAA